MICDFKKRMYYNKTISTKGLEKMKKEILAEIIKSLTDEEIERIIENLPFSIPQECPK